MKFKYVVCCSFACALAAAVSAQSSRRGSRGARAEQTEAEAAQAKMDDMVRISVMPVIGAQSYIMAPSLQVQGGLQPITKSRRVWGVFELTYRTQQMWTEDLTVNWYILADTSKSRFKDKSKAAKPLPPYVYYTLSTRYTNIYKGDHRSCACLPPSFLERYGDPVVISCEIVNSSGKLLDGENVVNGFPWVQAGKIKESNKAEMEWWNVDTIINAKSKKTGAAMIELRQGLVDRSKTPFYLVNSNDYETVQ